MHAARHIHRNRSFPMAGPFVLSPLPYAEDALAPTISAKTIGFHYGKHHKAYVETLNTLAAGTRYAGMKLEEVVRATAGKDEAGDKKIFNNAGQIWNHDFYWRSLSPKSTKPSGALAHAIEEFGGMDKLVEELATAGKTQFGSGWAWIVSKKGKLAVEKTPNAGNPMAMGVNCLLTVDVWEHAYYLDYQNARPKYLEEVLAKLLNWDFAAENLSREDHPVRAAA
jgi:superoxide dismutase, Fe-Mn family